MTVTGFDANVAAQLRATLNVIAAHTWYALPSGAFAFVNERCADYLGLPKDHPLRFGIISGGEWHSHIRLLHPHDREEARRVWSTCLRNGSEGEVAFRVRSAEGTYRWFLSRAEPLLASDGSLLYWIGINLDIEERKQAEFYLAEGQRLAHTGSWAFNSAGFQYWSPQLLAIHGLEPGRNPPDTQEYMTLVHPEDRDFVARAIDKMLSDHREFDFTKRIVRPDGEIRYIRCVGVPVTHGATFQGFVGTGMDVTEQERLTEELRRSEFYLAEGQRLGHAGSWSFRADLTCDYWSRGLYEILGFDPKNGIPSISDYLARVHPGDREIAEATIQRLVAANEGCDIKKRIIRPDGVQRVIRCVGTPVRENGVVTRFVGTLMDITEQEELAQELRRGKKYLTNAQALSHTGSVGMEVSTKRIFWSEESARIYGYPPGTEPTPDLILQRVHPDDVNLLKDVLKRAAQGGAEFDFEHRLLMPDGLIKYIYNLSQCIRDEAGREEVVGAIVDVTERKVAEEAIRRSEAYLAEAQRLSHTGSFGWKVSSGEIFWSDETFRIFQCDRTTKPTVEFVLSRVHPEDRDLVQRQIDRVSRDGKSFDFEHRLRLPDGSIKHVRVTAHPSRDNPGNLEFVGAVTDITERKTTEERIREREAELRQVLNLAPQFIAVFGPHREGLFMNRSGLDYFGLTLDEWRDKPCAVGHPDDAERVLAQWDRAISSGSAFESEERFRKGDGSYRWFLARYSPLRDEQGQITRWYVTGTDIEDRMRAEEKLLQENVALREEIDKASMFEEIVGTSPALQTALSRISKVAPTDSTVLITGETGTGKELVARAIHRRSHRALRAFISVNCAAIPRDLIASELFGHEKGAFTGAMQRRIGRFELAEGGTIFLDEVGELSADTQVALLRVLQEREFERVGGRQSIHVDVRVIAATNRDLKAAVACGAFRHDLYYRLNVFPLEVPPLRERRKDIPLLVQYFIDRYARKAGKNIRRVDKKTLQLLESYPWPGNIRELQNVIERSVIVCETEIFSVDKSWLSQQSRDQKSGGKLYLSEKLAAKEKEIIEEALRESQGRVFGPSGAAAKLGIARSTLELKIRSLNINKNRFKAGPGS